MSDKNIHQKINMTLPASIMTGDQVQMIKRWVMLAEIPVVETFVTRGHTTRLTFNVKFCIFERSNEKNHFLKTKIYFHKKTTPQLSGHIRLQNMEVGVKSNFGRLATIFQICAMDADILS